MRPIIVILLLSFKANATDYYVSNAGSDAANGLTTGTSWQTTAKVNSSFASLSPGDQVLFKRGDTFTGALNLNRSGSSGNVIVIGAYGTGAAPIITSLAVVTSWTNLGGGLYEKTLSSPPANTLNVVLFDGAVQPIGRYPKDGLGNSSYFTVSAYTTDSSRWYSSNGTMSSTGIASIPSFVGGEVVHKPYQWILNRATVTAQTSSVITFANLTPPWSSPTVTYWPTVGNGIFFQNHINTLTALGDWCYNNTTKKITMFFGAVDPTTHTVQVPTLDSLIQIKGNRSYITVRDLALRGANEYAVNLDTVQQINFIKVDINFTGINAINSHSSGQTTNNIKVDSCTINNTLNNALDCQTAPYWTITNNAITNTGMIAGMGQSGDGQYMGMFWVGSNSNIVSNRIDNCGYTAVYFTGSNINVQYNAISNYCVTKSDGGGIYTFDASGTNRIIQNNVVWNGLGNYYGLGFSDPSSVFNTAVHGIYMDGGVTNVVIKDNTSFNNSCSGLLVNNNNANITSTGNTFYNNGLTQQFFSTFTTGIISKHNIFFARDSSQLAMRIEPSSLAGLTSDSNYYCRPVWEPDGVNSSGYTTSPFSWGNYHDGAVIYLSIDGKFKSKNTWASYSSKDPASLKTYATVTDTSKIRFEYNATASSVPVILGSNTYKDVAGTNYQGTISLPAYTSIILLNPSAIATGPIIHGRKAVIKAP